MENDNNLRRKSFLDAFHTAHAKPERQNCIRPLIYYDSQEKTLSLFVSEKKEKNVSIYVGA